MWVLIWHWWRLREGCALWVEMSGGNVVGLYLPLRVRRKLYQVARRRALLVRRECCCAFVVALGIAVAVHCILVVEHASVDTLAADLVSNQLDYVSKPVRHCSFGGYRYFLAVRLRMAAGCLVDMIVHILVSVVDSGVRPMCGFEMMTWVGSRVFSPLIEVAVVGG